MSTEALDKGKFIQWLLKKEPTEIVAQDWTSKDCPICKFLQHILKEAFGVDHSPEVEGGGLFRFDWGDPTLKEMPAWAREFTYWADLVKPRSLTAEECLEIIYGPHFDETKWIGNERPIIIGPMVSI